MKSQLLTDLKAGSWRSSRAACATMGSSPVVMSMIGEYTTSKEGPVQHTAVQRQAGEGAQRPLCNGPASQPGVDSPRSGRIRHVLQTESSAPGEGA
jgi:hypothetical protein